MANTLTFNGTFTPTFGSLRPVASIATSITLSGSNFIANTLNVTSSAYTPLATSSLSDLRYAFFANNDATASIIVAFDTSGTKTLTVIPPDESAVIPYSSSIAAASLYAKAVGSTGSVVLDYILLES